ncbi:ABC transporter ATP-binding protein [Staphylococcus epidermidis]|uniref:ABC transporter transmembrane domain-containing protein n=1 Tax=Staphylococcus epidermidis TaxID=1282 RepID=UPI002094AF91|nr:ABC transporter transmembrane domain-containing protein [Staphylococcus epidermidis]MCO6211146.1 ABC transporter ATP-binding protein [Staphylococcus epidermidis]
MQIIDVFININIPNLISDFINQSLSGKQPNFIIKLAIIGIILYILSHFCTYGTECIFAKFSLKINFYIKTKIINSLYILDGEDIDNSQNKTMSILINDSNIIDSFVSKGLSNLITSFIYLTTILIVLLTKSLVLTSTLIISLIAIILFQTFVNNKIKVHSENLINSFDQVVIKIKNIVTYIANLVTLDTKRYIQNNYLETEYEYLKKRKKLNILFSIATIIPSLLVNINSIVIIGVGSYLIVNKQMSVGLLSVFIFYSNRLSSPINDIVNFFSGWNQVQVSINRCITLIQGE